jgi:hypothetical protein
LTRARRPRGSEYQTPGLFETRLEDPSGAKARELIAFSGTAEAVPFPKPFSEFAPAND